MSELDKKAALKGKKVYIYARVSTSEQEGTLPDQVKAIKKGLKALGFKGVPLVYEEQGSGTDLNRPVVNQMITDIIESGKPAVVVVRDIQRASRDFMDIGELFGPLRRLEKGGGVPIVSINEPIVTSTKTEPQPTGNLLASVFIGAGGQEVQTRKKQSLQGMKESKARGIKGGSPIELYPEETLNPLEEARRLIKMGVGQNEGARRVGRSTSWWKKQKSRIESLLLSGGDKKEEEWFKVMEMIRNMEIERGRGIAKKGTKARTSVRMQIVRRMTSAYENQPMDFPTPTREMLEEYYTNFNEYKPKRSR